MPFDTIQDENRDVSRRSFLKGALLGGAALTMSSKLAMAEQMMTGRVSVRDIRSAGLEPGQVDLSLNENPNGASLHAIQAMADHLTTVNRYTRDSGDLRESLIDALAAYDRVEFEKVKPERGSRRPPPTPYIFSYSGSSEFLRLLPMAYLSREGGDVVDAEGAYSSIRRAALSISEELGVPVNATSVPLTEDYRHDLDGMLKAITPKTKIVVITNPNNPTGTLLSFEEIERFVNAVPKEVIIVIDEAYIHFGRDLNYQRAMPLAMTNDNVIVIRTFSKAYGMAAMRVGYAVCSQAIQQKLSFYMTTGFPPVLPLVAVEATAKDLYHLRRFQQVVWAFQDRCYEEFDKLGLEYLPGSGSFFMVNVRQNGTDFARELLRRRIKVAVRNRDLMPTWIRVSAGTAPETEVFLAEFKKLLSKM